jgi:hypothetical protein
LSKIAINLSLGLYKGRPSSGEAFSPQKRTSAIQNMKFLYFFLFSQVIFALLDPDPDPATQFNADPDQDPQPFF